MRENVKETIDHYNELRERVSAELSSRMGFGAITALTKVKHAGYHITVCLNDVVKQVPLFEVIQELRKHADMGVLNDSEESHQWALLMGQIVNIKLLQKDYDESYKHYLRKNEVNIVVDNGKVTVAITTTRGDLRP